jgi:hypothetical protein
MTIRSVRAGIPWWPRGTRFASLPPPPTLATGAQAVSSPVVGGGDVPWALEWSLAGSFGHPIDRRLGGLRRPLLGVWLRRATGVGKVGWAHSRRRDGPCVGGATCAVVRRLAPPCKSAVSSWLLRPPWRRAARHDGLQFGVPWLQQ